nr:DNA-processing protein DprA [Leucobacter edaphi]
MNGTHREPGRTQAEGPANGNASCLEALARVAWSRLTEPGDRIAGMLIGRYGAPKALELAIDSRDPRTLHARIRSESDLELTPKVLAQALARWKPRYSVDAIRQDLRASIRNGASLLLPSDHAWPDGFADLGEHAPILLWVRGNPELLRTPSVAIVGARACTGYGSTVTAELTDAACNMGATVVSGAAYGIDAVAHRVALGNDGATVAVLAGGVDRPYPAAHTELLATIAQRGAVVSEMVPGAAPTRWRFLQRNRIIAALAAATLVTEAGVRSGSLNTAGHAAALGRELGAVPGPVTSSASAGCHALIRDYGAALITNAEELRILAGAPESGFARPERVGRGGPAPSRGGNQRSRSRASAEQGTEPVRRPGSGERAEPVASQEAGQSRGETALHRRLLDALPLRGARSEHEAARLAGVSNRDARVGYAELLILGHVARDETFAHEERRWKLRG